MEVLTYFVELIPTVGFPITCVIALAAFLVYMFKKINEQNKSREEKLYEEIRENREINAKAIDTIAHYAEKLDVIQNDVNEIKTDITVITKFMGSGN